MKINRKVKTAIIGLSGIGLLLLVVLVAHIALAKPVVYDNATIQVSRIDFREPIGPQKAAEIADNLKSIEGVTNDNIIVRNNVVVYFHDNRITNSKKVFSQLMAKGKYDARPFTVPAALASEEVCPVMGANSFSHRLSRGIQQIFN